ncbi:FecCD family ABC transporter permease [Corynebacterium sp. TAE3-ERU16]|uniref:FecCD family ABC transporter permease n=1 Tax=Corynebacterium sp. TAE3-ERU16 TaxID=2849493 RepID=UPI001C485B7F|nr:iron ABC transporter permease [Corynebacterium sp. TAE3-ERU16]
MPRAITSCGAPLLLLLLVAVAGILGITVGQTPMTLGDAIGGLFGTADGPTTLIVRELRVPRIAAAAVIGTALGLSGALLQSISRNPLASPDVLGITTGAGTAAVTVIVLGGEYGGASGMLAHIGLPLAALAGALATVICVGVLARGREIIKLLLIGVGIQAMLASVTSWLLIKASIVDAGRAIVWLTGSLNGSNWLTSAPVAVALVIGLPTAGVLARPLRVHALGADVAVGLGARLTTERVVAVGACVILAATATAAAGPISFVALGAPQIAKRLWRLESPPLFGAALTGTAITLWADWIGRVAGGDVTVPVGVVTAALGAPLLIYLIADSRKDNRL